jgi:organic hydroperoxide reductase OsmC/OhrA
MPEEDKPVRITRIVLRPHIVVASEVADERIHRYVELAHRECYIANSVSSQIEIEARIERVM